MRLREAFTLAAWVKPDAAFSGDGRIIDKALPGTDNGYLLDIHQGRPRVIVKSAALSGPTKVPAGEWSHMAATFDVTKGLVLYLNGKAVAEKRPIELPIDPEWLSQAHAMLRFVYAAAGRGAYPLKFNGSIFTVAGGGYDDDYRAWGGGYWFQNTRLPYWPMLVSGDFDLMQPFFKLYMDILPLSKERCRRYFNHDGALIPEMIWFWGTYPNRVYGWNREGRSVDWVEAGRIIHHYNNMLELLAIMLDYHAFTKDETFLKEKLVPMARELLTFFDEHYPRDPDGKFVIPRGMALESWDDVRNPAQDIAGLHWVLEGLLRLPESAYSSELRARWKNLREALPPLATTTTPEGKKKLAVGDVNPGPRRNVEVPELYSVFPFRIYGVGKPDLELARTTWRERDLRYYWGWHQDDIWAAMLGMTEEARSYLVQRMLPSNNTIRQGRSDSGQRFPVFWGPGHDWTPDGDHQGVAITTLQAMLLQYNGDIKLFPAWPRDWDVDFKLRAPDRTAVEGTYRAGKLIRLVVTPKEREKDIVLPEWLK
ncbi:LamG domain-containing protein [bacterium]|nr:LamG domain-containing protein [bacterium]